MSPDYETHLQASRKAYALLSNMGHLDGHVRNKALWKIYVTARQALTRARRALKCSEDEHLDEIRFYGWLGSEIQRQYDAHRDHRCEDCRLENPDHYGPMLKHELWLRVSDFKAQYLCSVCVERRLGRLLQRSDLLPVPLSYQWWAMHRKTGGVIHA